MVPLYSLREAIQYSGYFDSLRDQIGVYPNLFLQNAPIPGGDAVFRNITGICDQPDVLANWKSIVTKISDEHNIGKGLIFRVRFWPMNVACLDYKGGNAMVDNGMDANVSPHAFWGTVVDDIFVKLWKGLHVFGPFLAKLPVGVNGTEVAQDVFCTHLPMWTPTSGENSYKDIVEVQGTTVQNVFGFTMVYLNWSKMKEQSQMYERFEQVNLEFELFREEEPRLGDVGPKGVATKEMTKLAWSERADELNEGNSVEVRTESLHGIWVNR